MKKLHWLPLLCMTFSSLAQAQAPAATPTPAAPTGPGAPVVPAAPAAPAAPAKQRSFVLPVNWTTTPKYSMTVTIPNGFKPLQPENEMNASAELIEYIPENQDAANWTEIISVIKYIGKNIPAIKLVEEIKKKVLEMSTNGKVWLESNSTKPNYQEGILGLMYDYEGKHEVMGARYVSGPYDCVGVQYTIRPAEGQTDEDVSKIIENFFKSNLQIISFTPE